MTIPKRIQRKRTRGWRMPANAVYVGRPSIWGNYSESPEEFEKYARRRAKDDPEWLTPLCGLIPACWCAEDALWCHADILSELANEQ